MGNFIENLQKKPYETRVRILWVSVVIVVILLIIAWVFSLKSTIRNSSEGGLFNTNPIESNAQQSQDIIQVEYVTKNDSGLQIFFNVKNSTTNILNFSTLDDIVLTVQEKQYRPKSIQDRQANPFVKKVLSNTTDFGILVFEPVETAGKTGQLIFDDMTYENSTEIFKDEIELNFEELNQENKLRN